MKIEQLPRPERIKLAKAKREKLLDYFRYVLRNHKGKGIERANEGAPARWRLKEAAN